jgi:hypothetical protein
MASRAASSHALRSLNLHPMGVRQSLEVRISTDRCGHDRQPIRPCGGVLSKDLTNLAFAAPAPPAGRAGWDIWLISVLASSRACGASAQRDSSPRRRSPRRPFSRPPPPGAARASPPRGNRARGQAVRRGGARDRSYLRLGGPGLVRASAWERASFSFSSSRSDLASASRSLSWARRAPPRLQRRLPGFRSLRPSRARAQRPGENTRPSAEQTALGEDRAPPFPAAAAPQSPAEVAPSCAAG